jgi:hypothetical protein
MKGIIKFILRNYTLEDIQKSIEQAEEYAKKGNLRKLRKKMGFINREYLLLKERAGTCQDEMFGLAGRINNIYKIAFH